MGAGPSPSLPPEQGGSHKEPVCSPSDKRAAFPHSRTTAGKRSNVDGTGRFCQKPRRGGKARTKHLKRQLSSLPAHTEQEGPCSLSAKAQGSKSKLQLQFTTESQSSRRASRHATAGSRRGRSLRAVRSWACSFGFRFSLDFVCDAPRDSGQDRRQGGPGPAGQGSAFKKGRGGAHDPGYVSN